MIPQRTCEGEGGEVGDKSVMVGNHLTPVPSSSDYAVADFPSFEYSNRDVRRAGDTLRGTLTFEPECREETLRVFQIASSWRSSHAHPINSIMRSVSARIRIAGLEGITVARLKRMPSVRKKLRNHAGKLNQIQDLGGVRAILPSMNDANVLVSEIKEKLNHKFFDEDDYVADPKEGGYRSVHLIYKFQGKGEAERFDGRRIEIQVRSRLQHAWATAVEAAGLINGQDMKAGEGDERWLRLFDLMSAEFALVENAPVSRHVPERAQRNQEIKELNRALNAADVLDDLRYVSQSLDLVYTKTNNPTYYLLEYDHVSKQVRAVPKYGPSDALSDYRRRELENVETHNENRKTVLVEADNVESLKQAYPNYFTDVAYFTQTLRRILSGSPVEEYTVPPVHRAQVRREPIGDLQWTKGGYRRVTEEELVKRGWNKRKRKK